MAGSNISEEVRNFLNTTAKNNFLQKMEELKLLINQNPQVYFNYFVHQILLKKMNVAPAILQIYIDAIKVIGIKDSISLTISVIMDLFRKCMLINEDMLNQVLSQRPQQGVSFIKQYLIQLGQFLGLLTVANNRPIYAKELDIKQLLVEGFTSEKMKYVVTFVCRILKECLKSTIFKNQNPWVKANLDILKEIYLIIT
jgi:CCR4-NOT transcription complex subunit 1